MHSRSSSYSSTSQPKKILKDVKKKTYKFVQINTDAKTNQVVENIINSVVKNIIQKRSRTNIKKHFKTKII